VSKKIKKLKKKFEKTRQKSAKALFKVLEARGYELVGMTTTTYEDGVVVDLKLFSQSNKIGKT